MFVCPDIDECSASSPVCDLTQTAPILMDLITALARQDLQAMEKLAKVNKLIKLI